MLWLKYERFDDNEIRVWRFKCSAGWGFIKEYDKIEDAFAYEDKHGITINDVLYQSKLYSDFRLRILNKQFDMAKVCNLNQVQKGSAIASVHH